MLRAVLVLSAALGAGAVLAEPRGLSPEDLVTLDRVSSPVLSPDGQTVVFQLREVDYPANKAATGLWRVGVNGEGLRRLTVAGANATQPVFSTDGRTLYFLSNRGGSQQVWRIDLSGGEAQPVTSYPLDVGSFRLSPDGRALALGFEVHPDCPDLACSTARDEATAAGKASGRLHTQLFVRHWDSWKDGRRNQLYTATLGSDGRATGEPVKVSRGIDGDVPGKPFGGADDYAWAPDGRSLVFSARIAGRSEPWSTNFDLFRAPADGSAEPVNLTPDNPAWDASPVFSADGRTLYYQAMKRPGFEADRFGLMALDLASGKRREIAAGWDRSFGGLTLSPDGKRIYTATNDLGEHPLFAVELASGKVSKVAGGGNIGGFAVGRQGVVFAHDTLTAPADLYFQRHGSNSAQQITRFNRDRLEGVLFGGYEQFSFAGWNDETVHGYVVKPWNYEEGRSYPVAFIIHGGPQGSMGNSFHYRWNPQTYAARGFAVVFIDFHGSTGYGQAFTDAISGDWGGKPLEDLQKGWAAALAKYDFHDGDRACALGASYGGYMVNWIAGNWPEPWKCLVSHAGVFDNRMMGYSTEELWFDEWEFQGTPFEKPANYERHNPVNHVADWRVPMLVIHGQLDYRIPVEQGIGAFTALQRRGIPSQFLYFPDENHWILRPHNSALWHTTVNAWLEQHTAAP